MRFPGRVNADREHDHDIDSYPKQNDHLCRHDYYSCLSAEPEITTKSRSLVPGGVVPGTDQPRLRIVAPQVLALPAKKIVDIYLCGYLPVFAAEIMDRVLVEKTGFADQGQVVEVRIRRPFVLRTLL